jgi:hypothetical protein
MYFQLDMFEKKLQKGKINDHQDSSKNFSKIYHDIEADICQICNFEIKIFD